MDLLKQFQQNYAAEQLTHMSIQEYLELCKTDQMAYATSAERILAAIGEPEIIDTSKQERMSRVFMNRTIKVYPAFKDFYGMEDTIERVVGYFVHAAQGLEEKKQMLYIMGPPGGGKAQPLHSKVLTKCGWKTMGDICLDEEVVTPDGSTAKVKAIFPQGVKDIYKMTFADGRVVECCEDHLWKVYHKHWAKTHRWKIMSLKEIMEWRKTRKGDLHIQLLDSTHQIEDVVLPMDPYVMGVMLGDGCIKDAAFTTKDQWIVDRVSEKVIPGYELRHYPPYAYGMCQPYDKIPQSGRRNNWGQKNVYTNHYRKTFHELGMMECRSHTKFIPDAYKTSSLVQKLQLLQGLMDTDGCVDTTGNLTYCTISPKLAHDVQEIIHSIGGIAKVKEKMSPQVSTGRSFVVSIRYHSPWDLVSMPRKKERFREQYQYSDKSKGRSLKLRIDSIEFAGQHEAKCIYIDHPEHLYITDQYVVTHNSTIGERLKSLVEKYPIYVLQVGDELSPVFESPLGLFDVEKMAPQVSAAYGIPLRYFTGLPSPWAVKRLQELGGDISQMRVARIWPSKLKQVAIAKTEPGDENNQDISCLVGKVDIRQLEHYSQNDPDAYSYSGALCRGNQGITEMVEIWKAPIKVLHPLLTATQEGNYVGTEAIGGIPFQGVVFAHSNESEWQTFRNNKSNEAFLDRICVIKVPYCLRTDEEQQIYEKLLQNSSLGSAPCAPKTLEILSQFCVMSRLKPHENSNLWSKMRVYNGENIRDSDPRAKTIVEYRDAAGVDEGMSGISTRFAFKILSQTFNFDNTEVAADPVHLMYVLEQSIRREQFPEEIEMKYLEFIKEWIAPKYIQFLEKELQKTYLESYDEYGQNIYDRYVAYADAWISDSDYRDPDTGQLLNREVLNKELEKIEKPANIANPKDFRGEFVNYVLRARGRSENAGKNPKWTEYQKFREVIEKKIFSSTEELLPIISFGSKRNSEDLEKHQGFVNRMVAQGYTPSQCRRLVEYYIRQSKSH